MKIQYTLIVVLLVVISHSSPAQSNEVTKKKVTLPAITIRIDSLLQQLSKQTGTRFSFNPGKITASRKISFASRQQTIEQVLTQIRKTTGVGYKLLGNHIILVEQPVNIVQKKPGLANTNKKLTNGGKKMVSAGKLTTNTTRTSNPGKKINDHVADTSETMYTMQPVNANSKSEAVSMQKKDSVGNFQNEIRAENDSARLVVARDTNTSKDTVVGTPATQRNAGTKKEISFLQHVAMEAGLQGLGINYSANAGRKWLIEFSVGLGGGYFVTGQQFYYSFTILKPVFYVKAQPKIFLNREGQKEGDYIGLNLKYTTGQLFSKSYNDSAKWVSLKGYSAPALLMDVHWGFQEELGDRWHLDGHLGIGYAFDFRYRWGSNHWYPAVGLKASYRLRK
jgi:hypothetical protein